MTKLWPNKYHPLNYLGDLSPTALEQRMEQLLMLYEAARVRAAFEFGNYPENSATYAAWLYYRRLPAAISKLIKNPSDVKCDPTEDVYQKIVRKAKSVEEWNEIAGEES